MSEPRLSETSYLVLGMLEHAQPATPYDLKQVAELSSKYFWTIPHSLLYAECERLAKEGLLAEEREPEGRRRRIYRVTKAGMDALEAWRAEPGRAISELRDLGYLKLFLGADPAMLARAHLPEHEATLQRFEELRNASGGVQVPRGPWLAFDAGIRHMRESVRFWKALLKEEEKKGASDR
ncbi:MAG: PadR family transcriptional regulator [Solirubrobacteraceae bacterium]